MADPFSKIPAGSSVTAFSITAWNRMLDMLRWWVQNQNGMGISGNGIDRNNNLFDIQNTSGSTVPWLGVLGIDAPLYTPTQDEDRFRRKPVMKGVTPVAGTHEGKWGVLTEPVADNGIAKIALAGVMPIRVYVTNARDKFVDISASHTVSEETVHVATGGSGFQLLWLDSGSAGTIQWAIVRLGGGGGGHRRCTCQATANNLDGSILADIDVDHVYGITFAGLLPPLVSSSSLLSVDNPDGWAWSSGGRMRIEWNETGNPSGTSGRWEVTFAQCPVG